MSIEQHDQASTQEAQPSRLRRIANATGKVALVAAVIATGAIAGAELAYNLGDFSGLSIVDSPVFDVNAPPVS